MQLSAGSLLWVLQVTFWQNANRHSVPTAALLVEWQKGTGSAEHKADELQDVGKVVLLLQAL